MTDEEARSEAPAPASLREDPKPTRALPLAPLAILVAIAILGAAWAGRVSEGRRSLADADAALARGDKIEAILAARAAAEARCPSCSAPDEGYARLEAIAKDTEHRGDDVTAFAAWRSIRAATLASAVFAVESERRTRAEQEIARLGHRIHLATTAAGTSPAAAASEDRLRATLGENTIPHGSAFAVVGVGGVLFLFFAWRFTAKGNRADAAVAAAGAAVSTLGALLF